MGNNTSTLRTTEAVSSTATKPLSSSSAMTTVASTTESHGVSAVSSTSSSSSSSSSSADNELPLPSRTRIASIPTEIEDIQRTVEQIQNDIHILEQSFPKEKRFFYSESVSSDLQSSQRLLRVAYELYESSKEILTVHQRLDKEIQDTDFAKLRTKPSFFDTLSSIPSFVVTQMNHTRTLLISYSSYMKSKVNSEITKHSTPPPSSSSRFRRLSYATGQTAYQYRKGILAMVPLFLIVDYIYYGWIPFVRWRMKISLRKCSLPKTITSTTTIDSLEFNVPFPIVSPKETFYNVSRLATFKEYPVILYGPRKSGKTFVCDNLARYAVSTTTTDGRPKSSQPVIYVSIPEDNRRNISLETDTSSTVYKRNEFDRLTTVSQQVFHQVNFPVHVPYLSRFYDQLRSREWYIGSLDKDTLLDYRIQRSIQRFHDCIDSIFMISHDISNERLYNPFIETKDAPVLILLDNLDMLGRDPYLHRQTTEKTPQTYMKRIHNYLRGVSADSYHTQYRTILTTSNTYLFPYWGSRTELTIQEPTYEEITKALNVFYFKEPFIQKCVDHIGKRIGYYRPYMTETVTEVVRRNRRSILNDYDTFFRPLTVPDDRIQMIRLLDRLYKITKDTPKTNPETTTVRTDTTTDSSSSTTTNSALPTVSLDHVPSSIRLNKLFDHSYVLHLRSYKEFEFTTKQHRIMWPVVREWYYPPSHDSKSNGTVASSSTPPPATDSGGTSTTTITEI